MTASELESRLGVSIDEHLAREVEIPVIAGRPQRQGDVLFVPAVTSAATTPLTRAGYPVVRGEVGGNTHRLHADQGESFYSPACKRGGTPLTIQAQYRSLRQEFVTDK